MALNRLFTSAASLALLVGLLVVSPGHASAKGAQDHAGAARDAHCIVVIDKVRPGETSSRVVRSACGEQVPATTAAEVPLITYYEHLNFAGRSKTVYGSAGPCDADGYRIGNVGDLWCLFWNVNITSFRYGSGCYYVNAYDHVNLNGTCWHYNGNTGYVGASANDTISSFRVSSALRLCAWK